MMKKISSLLILLSSLLFSSCSFELSLSLSNSSNTSSDEVTTSKQDNSDSITSSIYQENGLDNLEIYFLELGNKFVGDSVYIKAGETDILIDAGSRTTSSFTLTSFINQHCKDKKLEYIIATHAHQDHIAGFIGSNANPGIFDTYECKTIIDFPLTNQNLGKQTVYGKYVDLRDKEVENGAVHYTALECYNNENGAKRIYEVAKGITLEILYNEYYKVTSSEENNYSVCVLLRQGENSFLFTGDLEKKGEEKLVEHNDLPHVKVFKGGHHGSGNANSTILLDTITPENICICTCAGTSEYTDISENQFPYQETINRMAMYTKNIYITSQVDKYVSRADWAKAETNNGGTIKSMNGTIQVLSTPETFEIHGSNNDLILKETEWFKANRTWPSNGVQ